MPDIAIGIAKGGPRDGVRLSAGPSWDGRVRKKGKPDSSHKPDDFYSGNYVWIRYNGVKTWVWIPGTPTYHSAILGW